MGRDDGTGWEGIIEQEWVEWDEIGIYRWHGMEWEGEDNLGHDDAILTVPESQQSQNPLLLEAYYLFISHYVCLSTIYGSTYVCCIYVHIHAHLIHTYHILLLNC